MVLDGFTALLMENVGVLLQKTPLFISMYTK